jgi:hypothetical protein
MTSLSDLPKTGPEGAPTYEGAPSDTGALPDTSRITTAAEDVKAIYDQLKEPPPPPPISPWVNFWEMMRESLKQFRDSLPSMKEAIGTNLISSIQGVGDVFANAIAYWDGTAKGFFQSLAQGFRQLVQQIIAELVRLMVVKAIMSIVGTIAGGAIGGLGGGGGSTPTFGGAGANHGIGSFAMGGFTGVGGLKDIAGIVHKGEFVLPASAVRRFGLPYLESLRNMTPGFAMGGYTGGSLGSSVYNNTTTNAPINLHFHANQNGQFSKESAEQAAKKMIALQNQVARRQNGFT